MTPEEVRLAANVVKAVGELGKPMAQVAADLLKNILGPASTEVGQMLSDNIAQWRARNVYHTLEIVHQQLTDAGMTPKVLPRSFVVKVIEAVKDVDDSELQQLFAQLLSTAAPTGNQPPRSIVALVESFDSEDAHAIKMIADGMIKSGYNEMPVVDLDKVDVLDRLQGRRVIKILRRPSTSAGADGQLLSGADNLVGPFDVDPAHSVVCVTRYGRQLLSALGYQVSDVQDPDWAQDDQEVADCSDNYLY